MPCMYESPRTMPRSGASGSGSGPRRPHELVVCREVATGTAGVPRIASASPGPSGTRKNIASTLVLWREVPQPDRAGPRPEAIGPPLVVGLEDRRRQQQRQVVIAPPQQAVPRVEPGIPHTAASWPGPPRRRPVQPAPGCLDAELAIPAPMRRRPRTGAAAGRGPAGRPAAPPPRPSPRRTAPRARARRSRRQSATSPGRSAA